MFIERDINAGKRTGVIEVITGSMFSGKTEELIRRLRRAGFARQKVDIVKPATDGRYSESDVGSPEEHAIRWTQGANYSKVL